MKEIHYLLGNQCNLKCDFCFWDIRLSPVPLKKSISIIDEIVSTGIKRITVSGGEPTFNPTFKEQLDYMSKNNLEVILHTNALLIDKSLSEFIAPRVSRVSLSLDGSNKNVVKKMRKVESAFTKTVDAIDLFIKLGIKVNVKTIVSKVNSNDLINIGKLLLNKNIEYWSLLEFNPINRGKVNKDVFAIPDSTFDSIVSDIKKEFPSMDIRTRLFKRKPEKYCFITASGEVFTFIPGKGDILVGDLEKESLQEQLLEI